MQCQQCKSEMSEPHLNITVVGSATTPQYGYYCSSKCALIEFGTVWAMDYLGKNLDTLPQGGPTVGNLQHLSPTMAQFTEYLAEVLKHWGEQTTTPQEPTTDPFEPTPEPISFAVSLGTETMTVSKETPVPNVDPDNTNHGIVSAPSIGTWEGGWQIVEPTVTAVGVSPGVDALGILDVIVNKLVEEYNYKLSSHYNCSDFVCDVWHGDSGVTYDLRVGEDFIVARMGVSNGNIGIYLNGKSMDGSSEFDLILDPNSFDWDESFTAIKNLFLKVIKDAHTKAGSDTTF